MKRRLHLRKKLTLFKKKNRVHGILMIAVVLVFISVFGIIKFIGSRVSPIILSYAESEARKIATVMINSAVSQKISDNLNVDSLFIMTKDSKGEISTIDFVPAEVNKVLTEITEVIQNNLKSLEKGNIDNLDIPASNYLSADKELKKGIIFEIPSGVVSDNALLSNLGPKIPVKLNLVGDILSEINTKVTNYGINNALIEIRINIKLIEQVLLPVSSNQIEIETSVPITLKLIQGNVPNYYIDGISGNSSVVSIPTK